MKIETIAVHGGFLEDANTNAVSPPLYQSTTFTRDDRGNLAPKGYYYTRLDNPNRKSVEEKITKLEGGVESCAFSSGQAACHAILHSVLSPGDHCIIPDDCYHGISHLVNVVMSRSGIHFTTVDMTDLRNIEQAVRPETKLILVESPSNPLLKITDIRGAATIAKSGRNILLACDNTWATPCTQNPLGQGADLVFHSSTKFFGGHSDILGGCVVFKEKGEILSRCREFQQYGGAVPSPFDCWLLYRSLATLVVRVKTQIANAAEIVTFLNHHKGVEKVFYPGLPAHINHTIAKSQMTGGFGSMLSVQIRGGEVQSMRFASSLKLFKHATSLGGVESLVDHRRSIELEPKKTPGNLIRISVGIENAQDLIDDLKQALADIEHQSI